VDDINQRGIVAGITIAAWALLYSLAALGAAFLIMIYHAV